MSFEAKLRALVRGQWGASPADASIGSFPGGATLRSGATGWVLVEERGERALGGALAWADRSGATELHLLVSDPHAAGVLARRATALARPPRVWQVEGLGVEPAAPAPFPPDPPLSDADTAFVPLIEGAGADPVVEHGVLRAEVLGLEVGRVTDGVLEVGVGKHDRETQKLVHAGRPTAETLRAAVARVREVRRPGALPHPMNQYAAARWLRSVVIAHPELVGAKELHPVSPPLPRGDLREHQPAPAAGDGVIVVCSTGIDVDLVPTAADARLAHDPAARLVLVVPEPDAHPLTRTLAAQLADPAEVVTVPAGWREDPGSL